METDPANPPVVTPQPPAQTTQSIVNPDGSFVENWTQNEPEEDKPTLSRFKNVGDLKKSYMDLRKKFGRDPDGLIQVPKDDSPDDVKTAFYKAAGKPETVDEYKFEKSTDLSEKVEVVDDQVKAFAQIAHKYHLNNAQFNGIVNDYLALIGKDIDAFDLAQTEKGQQDYEVGMAELKKVFKDGLEQRALRANALLRKYGNVAIKDKDGNEVSIMEKLFEESPKLKNSPWMTMLLDNIAEAMSEDTLKGIATITTPTVGQVEAKIAELRKHPAYMDKMNPQHKQIIQQIADLYTQKKPA